MQMPPLSYIHQYCLLTVLDLQVVVLRQPVPTLCWYVYRWRLQV